MMENTARKIVTLDNARVVGHVQLEGNPKPALASAPKQPDPTADFLAELASFTGNTGVLRREHGRMISEIVNLQAENRWQDIVALFYPVEEKAAEIVAAGMDGDLRGKVAFALVRLHRADDAIRTLLPAASRQPEDALIHYTLGYAVVDELFSARTERRIVPGKKKQELIALAHTHFARARALRPDSVTFCYREAILYKEIEGKPKLASPLFEQAIRNWEKQNPQEREKHHQQRPKYVKSLYHLASCLLDAKRPQQSLQLLHRLEQEDSEKNYLHPLFKHFAFGKVLHGLGQDQEALCQLETAAHRAEPHQPTDFVWELAARCALRLGQTDRAQGYIARVPSNRKRPYVVWTEADILAAQGRAREALQLLRTSAERDKRSCHVSLIRIARLLLGLQEYENALVAATQAARFCQQTYGNPSKEALFWQAAGLHLLGKNRQALDLITELEAGHFQYPHFGRLAGLIRAGLSSPGPGAANAPDRNGRDDHGTAAFNQ